MVIFIIIIKVMVIFKIMVIFIKILFIFPASFHSHPKGFTSILWIQLDRLVLFVLCLL